MRAAAILSVVIHAGAIAWFGRHDSGDRAPPDGARKSEMSRSAVDPTPMDVVLLENVTVSAAPIAPPRPPVEPVRAAASSTRRAATTTSSTSHPPPEPAAAPPPHASVLTMRWPEMKNRVSDEFVERFLEHSKPPAPNDVASEGVAGAIATAKGRLDDPRWIASATPEQVTDEQFALAVGRDTAENAELRTSANGHHTIKHQTFHADVRRDGTLSIGDESNLQAVHVCNGKSWICKIPVGATFDVTDGVMRSHGADPYASAKLKVLDDTRDERAALGARYRKELFARSVELVQQGIAQLWATTTDPAARKQALFELWDDCAETGEPDVVAAGGAVRDFVIGFIRSKVSYSADELARLNAQRHSTATFTP